jgi:subtilisin family serine protease
LSSSILLLVLFFMKTARLLLILFVLLVFGGMLGFFLSQRSLLDDEADSQRGAESLPTQPEVVADFPRLAEQVPSEVVIDYPPHAIQGEMVLHFSNRKDYLAYLKALANAGLAPIGQIDELMVVRVGDDALAGPHPGNYQAGLSFSYPVARPLPPVEIDSGALASLQAFGQSARAIVGAPVGGDGTGILVGILDSGIKAHSQFDDVYIVHIDLVGGGVAGPGAAHGTSVASIITGSEGIAPAAELFVVRVLDDQGSGNSFHVAEGIVQAVDLGVQVLNMSLGMYQDTQLLREAVRYAHERGVILVAAAGNDGYNQISYPAAYPQVLAVTAIDAAGRQAIFPNQSALIDFAAPGVGVLSANEDFGSVSFSGTSAAAPFVSGTLAALLSADRSRTPSEAIALMKRYLDDAGAPGVDPVYGGGLVDWNRLRERATPGILDAALADIYLSSAALPGTTMPIEVTVQNRGTKWFSNATLSVLVGEAEPVDFTIGSLGPGQTTTRKVYAQVPSRESGVALNVAAQVIPEQMMDDVRLENNIKAVLFQPKQ